MNGETNERQPAPAPPAVPAEAGGSSRDDVQAVKRLHEAYGVIRSELSKVIVGQEEVIDLLLIALFARGHVILEGVPGLAKTLMISSVAHCLGLKFHRSGSPVGICEPRGQWQAHSQGDLLGRGPKQVSGHQPARRVQHHWEAPDGLKLQVPEQHLQQLEQLLAAGQKRGLILQGRALLGLAQPLHQKLGGS